MVIPFHQSINPYHEIEKKMVTASTPIQPNGDTRLLERQTIDPKVADQWKAVANDNFLSESTRVVAQQLATKSQLQPPLPTSRATTRQRISGKVLPTIVAPFSTSADNCVSVVEDAHCGLYRLEAVRTDVFGPYFDRRKSWGTTRRFSPAVEMTRLTDNPDISNWHLMQP